MFIKDLEIAKELSHEERAAVRGGNQYMFGGWQNASGYVFGNVTQVAGPQIQTDVHPTTIVDVDTTTISKSLSAVDSLLNGVSL
jgi:hypothetical protein